VPCLSGTHARAMRTLMIVVALATLLFASRVGHGEEPTFRGNIQKLTKDNSDLRRVETPLR